MKLEQGNFCPLIGKDCIQLGCSWFTQVRGKNPQTGDPVDEHGCAVAWLPILLIENSNMQRQTGSAVESLRNRVAEAAQVVVKSRPLEYKPNGRRNSSDRSSEILLE